MHQGPCCNAGRIGRALGPVLEADFSGKTTRPGQAEGTGAADALTTLHVRGRAELGRVGPRVLSCAEQRMASCTPEASFCGWMPSITNVFEFYP